MSYLPLSENTQYTTKLNLEQCKKYVEEAFSSNQTYRLTANQTEFQIVRVEPDQSILTRFKNAFAPTITIHTQSVNGNTLLHCRIGVLKSAEDGMRTAAGLAMLAVLPTIFFHDSISSSLEQACTIIFVGFVITALSIYFYARTRDDAERNELRIKLNRLLINLNAEEKILKAKPPIVGTIVFVGVIALIFSWWFGSYVFEVYQSQSWLSTKGTITRSAEKPVRSDQRKYETHYIYNYTVSGQPYVSERYAFEGNGNFLGSPGPYKVGDQVTVYYDSQNPQQALLERTKFQDACNSLIIPLIAIAFAVIAALWTVDRATRPGFNPLNYR